jgi:zinc-ribbon domain
MEVPDPMEIVLGFLFLCLVIIIVVRLGKHVSSEVDRERAGAPGPASTEAAPSKQAGFCPACGKEYAQGDGFCRKCGAKL